MGVTITTRVPKEIEKDIAFFVKAENLDKSTLARRLLVKALAEKKIEYALDLYRKKEISLWKAAKFANVPLANFMEFLKEKHIHLRYSEKDLEEDIESAKRY